MHYSDAMSAVDSLLAGNQQTSVGFVSPVLSTMVAASTMRGITIPSVQFSGGCDLYAWNVGLTDVIRGSYTFPAPGGLQGRTYTKLTRLATHAEVHACNSIVTDLIWQQIRPLNDQIADRLARVVGELHDNVASHAIGTGFSAAQVYDQSSANPRIEFAIADIGRGMLGNVQRVRPAICDDAEAILWCVGRGHTTAAGPDPWAQRLPEDALHNPYPTSVQTRSQEDHHIGEGLWILCELVKFLGGRLWICSGSGQYLLSKMASTCKNRRFLWPGVAIELEVRVSSGQRLSAEQRLKFDALAERIGL